MMGFAEEVSQFGETLLAKGYRKLGKGRNRTVYRSPNGQWVVKLPIGVDGLEDNQREATLWKTACRNHIARCRLLNNRYLVMECIATIYDPDTSIRETIRTWNDFPAWTCQVDCFQVGRNRKGHLVAYDYADSRAPYETDLC